LASVLSDCASGSQTNNLRIRADSLGHYELRDGLQPVDELTVSTALASDATARRILAKGFVPQAGLRCGIRLNINVLRQRGVAVHSVHRGRSTDGYTRNKGWWSGEVLSYAPVVVLRDAYFNVSQIGRERIASGGAKDPMASIDGEMVLGDRISFDGVSVGFNPVRHHLFCDSTGAAVRYASDVTIMGHRAFCRGIIEYYARSNAPERKGTADSVVWFRA
jgi:hypothetical protein